MPQIPWIERDGFTVVKLAPEVTGGRTRIPPVRRGTTKRRAAARGMHMSDLFGMRDGERQITHKISERGRRR